MPNDAIQAGALQCHAHTRSGERCKNPAVLGYEVCRMHGAGNRKLGTEGGRPIVHGMYSSKVNTVLAEQYEEFLGEVDNVQALTEDIALMRAMMTNILQDDPTSPEGRQQQMNNFLRYMRDIRYAIELKDDIESKYMVSIETVQIFLNQLLYILKKHIKDEDLLLAVMEDMRKVKILDQETQQPNRLLRDKNRKR